MSSEKIKENIIKEINKLPEESLKEINDFVSFILAKSNLTGEKKKNTSPHVIDERVYKRKKKHALPNTFELSVARRAGRPAYRTGRFKNDLAFIILPQD